MKCPYCELDKPYVKAGIACPHCGRLIPPPPLPESAEPPEAPPEPEVVHPEPEAANDTVVDPHEDLVPPDEFAFDADPDESG